MITSYEDIEAFQNAKALYPQIVQATESFPRQGWHLRDQLCRSAGGIQANIAEGYGRSTAELKMYLTRALGSCNETKAHIENAMSVSWLSKKTGQALLDEYIIVSKQLYRLRQSWQ